MAVTTISVAKTSPRKDFFAHSFYFTDGVNCEQIKAAHATKPFYITRLVVAGDFDGYIIFGDGEATNAVETPALYLLATATGLAYDLSFEDKPIKLTAAKSITVESSAAGPVAGIVEGFTAS